jgi:hypothetical protein
MMQLREKNRLLQPFEWTHCDKAGDRGQTDCRKLRKCRRNNREHSADIETAEAYLTVFLIVVEQSPANE